MTKALLPLTMSTHSYGLVGASKILFSVLPEIVLPTDNTQWKQLFKTVDLGDVIRFMIEDIRMWEDVNGVYLNKLDSSHRLTTLPSIYNVVAMKARHRAKSDFYYDQTRGISYFRLHTVKSKSTVEQTKKFQDKRRKMKIHVEVFIASRILYQNKPSFSPSEIIDFIHKKFNDERHGIPTHVTAACVANAPMNHPYCYNYLWRIRPGEYRIFKPRHDPLNPEKRGFRDQPYPHDVPEKYQYLLHME